MAGRETEAQVTAIPDWKLKNGSKLVCQGRLRQPTVPMASVHRWTKAILETRTWFLGDSKSQITVGKEEVGGSLVSSAGTGGRDRKDKNNCT